MVPLEITTHPVYSPDDRVPTPWRCNCAPLSPGTHVCNDPFALWVIGSLVNMALKPSWLVSVCTNGRSKSGQAKTGADVRASLSWLNALCSLLHHIHRAFFFVRAVSGAARVEKFGMNLLYHEATPRNCRTLRTVVRIGQSVIALTFSGSVRIMLYWSMIWRR